MIHLPSDPPKQAILQKLEQFSGEVSNLGASHLDQIANARKRWKTFLTSVTCQEVKKWLKELTAYPYQCHYCEYGEGSDIEHIYPKSHFPRLAFNWHNLILSCKQCNTGHKLAKFAVFDLAGRIENLNQRQNPVTEDGVFIHPRETDPNSLILLNLLTFEFEIIAENSSRNFEKAHFTLKTLELNRRDLLIAARKNSHDHLHLILDRTLNYLHSDSIEALERLIHDPDFDWNRSLHEIKNSLLEICSQQIKQFPNRSVWEAIKRQSSAYPKWKYIFDCLPQALDW